MKHYSKFIIIAIALLGAAAVADARATRIEGVEFAPSLNIHDTSFELKGLGLLRYRVVFRAYVGALYLGNGATLDQFGQQDVPMRLELEYFWPIKGADFGPAAVPFLKDNLAPDVYARIAARAERLSALYQDVRPGDRYALTFIPGRGTELALNDKPLGLIEGDDFAVAYFQVWLGERPIDTRFRDQLLARPRNS